MASPNAAGVAALIWSLHPTWTRAQVVAQLLGTADNINAQNPNYQNLLGSGRVNAHRALTGTLKPPKFDSVIGLPSEGGTYFGELKQFEIDLGSVFGPGSMMNPANWQLRWAGSDGKLNTGDDKLLTLAFKTSYMVGTNRFRFEISGVAMSGLYQFKAISGGLVDPFGTPLDGNGNGVGGDNFIRNFYINSDTLPEEGGNVPFGTVVSAPVDQAPILHDRPKPNKLSTASTQNPIAAANVDQVEPTTATSSAGSSIGPRGGHPIAVGTAYDPLDANEGLLFLNL
jgi:hypothetical protein